LQSNRSITLPVITDKHEREEEAYVNEWAANAIGQTATPPVIDYEGSPYRRAFWEGQGREYEDQVERLALQRLLPTHGPRLAEIGAGFGRLADLYQGYEQVILFDYSRTLLKEAVQQWGSDPRFIFVAGNLYALPLATATLDSLVMVRVMHHLADVPQALGQLRRVLHRHSVAVLEYANKRNLKAILRWLVRRQMWSPLRPEPVEFVTLNFDFHPVWVAEQMATAQLAMRQQLAVSHFRIDVLKQRFDASQLAQVDSLLFRAGGRFPLAPSVFVQAVAVDAPRPLAVSSNQTQVTALFRCPACGGEAFELSELGVFRQILCQVCGKKYQETDQIWDFKTAIE
jgi:SAM-dependent methyltransferase